jgi:hypothetical protein
MKVNKMRCMFRVGACLFLKLWNAAMLKNILVFQDEHPPIPEHLSPDITDFLHQCFRKVVELLKYLNILMKCLFEWF